MESKEFLKLYKKVFNLEPSGVEKLPGAGSSRRYWRIFSPCESTFSQEKTEDAVCRIVCEGERATIPKSVIATEGDDPRENAAFIGLAKVFGASPVLCRHIPVVYGQSDDCSCYLQQDLGNFSFSNLIAQYNKGRDAWNKGDIAGEEANSEGYDEMNKLLKKIVDLLVAMQTLPESLWDRNVGFEPFSRKLIMWDLNYFKYCFLKPARVCFDESALEDDFNRYADVLMEASSECQGFMYRDFQSRNIMLVKSENSNYEDSDNQNSFNTDSYTPYFIDFQGGRKGPIIYDVISLMWQAKAQFSSLQKREIIEYYFDVLGSTDAGKSMVVSMRVSMPQFLLFRVLQVLGAYGFRGLVERKAHFLESIPLGINNLREVLNSFEYANALSEYPELKRCCEQLVAQSLRKRDVYGGLTVEVFSFSYKSGYPEDISGNGGGFMFDCRGMHNPGRYDEYKPLTGRDTPVIDFLESQGEVQPFLEEAYSMVSHSVETYIRRGFNNLQVGFGCTGGRHRSVYCAEHMAHYLAQKYPTARIVLRHREQGWKNVLNG